MIPVTEGCLTTNEAILLGILTLRCICTPPTPYIPLLRLCFSKRLHIQCGEKVAKTSLICLTVSAHFTQICKQICNI